MPKRAPTAFFLTAVLALGPAAANDLEIVARLDSDWMYHGFSESVGDPAIGLSVDWQGDSPLFAGFSAHRVFDDSIAPRPWSAAVYVGVGAPISDRVYLTGSVQHRRFPDSIGDWDYTELEVELDYRFSRKDRLRLRLDYGADYYDLNTSAVSVEADYVRDLSARLYGYARLGAIHFSQTDRIPNYQYGRIGAGLRYGAFVFDLSWRANSEGDETTIGVESFSDPKLVAQLSWRLR